MECTQWKLPQGTYTNEVTKWTYTMEVTSRNLNQGSYLVELTP